MHAERLAWELIERRAATQANQGRLVSTPALGSRVSESVTSTRPRSRLQSRPRSRSRSRSRSKSRSRSRSKSRSRSRSHSRSRSPSHVAAAAAASSVSKLIASKTPSSSSMSAAEDNLTERDVSAYSEYLLGTISKPTALGDSALHLAVSSNYQECVEYLLRYGADPNTIALASGMAPYVLCHQHCLA